MMAFKMRDKAMFDLIKNSRVELQFEDNPAQTIGTKPEFHHILNSLDFLDEGMIRVASKTF